MSVDRLHVLTAQAEGWGTFFTLRQTPLMGPEATRCSLPLVIKDWLLQKKVLPFTLTHTHPLTHTLPSPGPKEMVLQLCVCQSLNCV